MFPRPCCYPDFGHSRFHQLLGFFVFPSDVLKFKSLSLNPLSSGSWTDPDVSDCFTRVFGGDSKKRIVFFNFSFDCMMLKQVGFEFLFVEENVVNPDKIEEAQVLSFLYDSNFHTPGLKKMSNTAAPNRAISTSIGTSVSSKRSGLLPFSCL